MGLPGGKKRTPAKGGQGSSRGGLVNKKTKAAFELSGASIADHEEGKGLSTAQAKEMQQPKAK